jgi:hypothetical protein
LDIEGMRINSTRQDRTVHAATVEHDVVLRLIAERVAEKVGTALERGGVTWRAYFSTRDTSTGIKTDVFVEITEDHRPQTEQDA